MRRAEKCPSVLSKRSYIFRLTMRDLRNQRNFKQTKYHRTLERVKREESFFFSIFSKQTNDGDAGRKVCAAFREVFTEIVLQATNALRL